MGKLRAQVVREHVEKANKDGLELERANSKTGFKNVIKLANGTYQARLREPGHEQRAVPGTFASAKEAATWLAILKREPGEEELLPPTAARAARGKVALACLIACTHTPLCSKRASYAFAGLAGSEEE